MKFSALKQRNKNYTPLRWIAVCVAIVHMTGNIMSQSRPAREAAAFLSLGDSYTIGEGVTKKERWTFQAAGQLRSAGFSVADPVTVARTGWTTGELIAAVKQTEPGSDFDLVSLLIGVNNQYRGIPADVFQQEFKDLLDIAARFAGGDFSKVFVLSIPDWGSTPFAAGRDAAVITREIDQLNNIAEVVCREKGVAFVNITPVSRRAKDNQQYLAGDKLHYSAEMYELWAAEALPVMKNILSAQGR